MKFKCDKPMSHYQRGKQYQHAFASRDKSYISYELSLLTSYGIAFSGDIPTGEEVANCVEVSSHNPNLVKLDSYEDAVENDMGDIYIYIYTHTYHKDKTKQYISVA